MVPPPLNRRQLREASDLAGYAIVIGLKSSAGSRPALARLRFVSFLERPWRQPWLFFWPRVYVRLRASGSGNAPVLGPWTDQGAYPLGKTVLTPSALGRRNRLLRDGLLECRLGRRASSVRYQKSARRGPALFFSHHSGRREIS
jgi:hypothetical protein